MGRPINKKFFGNLRAPYTDIPTSEASGTGGESVATIAINNSGTLYTTSTTLNLTFSNPQIAGGTKATGRVTTNGAGNLATVTLLNAGTGYTSAPTVTVNGGTTGTTATFTLSLTSNTPNAIKFTSYLTTGSSAIAGGDIHKQEASRRYLVENAQGIGQCKLVTTSTLTAGTMNVIATDKNGSTYFVKKLTARRAVLVPYVVSGSFEFATNQAAGWTLGSATTGTVSIANN